MLPPCHDIDINQNCWSKRPSNKMIKYIGNNNCSIDHILVDCGGTRILLLILKLKLEKNVITPFWFQTNQRGRKQINQNALVQCCEQERIKTTVTLIKILFQSPSVVKWMDFHKRYLLFVLISKIYPIILSLLPIFSILSENVFCVVISLEFLWAISF